MTQHHNGNVVRIFSARACAAPLEKAAKLFEQQTGIAAEISVCSRHCARPVAEEATGQTGGDDFLLEIADAGIHDLAIGGAEYLLDDGEVRGIVQKGKRRTIGYRTSALLVPAGNPKGIRSVEDMARPGVRVAVSVIDCLKGCGKISAAGWGWSNRSATTSRTTRMDAWPSSKRWPRGRWMRRSAGRRSGTWSRIGSRS